MIGRWQQLLVLFGLALLTAGFSAGAVATPVQWDAGVGGNGHYYDVIVASSGIDWPTANSDAVARGGYLVTILSAAENQFVYDNLASNSAYWRVPLAPYDQQFVGPWIGAYQEDGSAEPSADWTWVNGDGSLSSTYANWLPSEPNNGDGVGEEDAALFYDNNLDDGPVTTSKWNDWPMSNVTLSYVIEYDTEPVPEPTALWLLTAGLAVGVVGRRLNPTARRR